MSDRNIASPQQRANVLQYHFGDLGRYTIYYITTDKQEMKKQALQQIRKDHVRNIFDQQNEIDGRTVYLLYIDTSRTTLLDLEGLDTVEDIQNWVEEHFTELETSFLLLVGFHFGEVLGTYTDRQEWLELYKEMELKKHRKILKCVSWGDDVVSVAGELLSHFIQQHPMPNTNHRTGIGVLEHYLSTVADDDFELPETGDYEGWKAWVQQYINDSKRLLTLRRRASLLSYAQELNYDIVERKEGIQIRLDEHDLEHKDSHDYYSQQHINRSTEFVKTVLAKTNREDLKEYTDDGKNAFLTQLGQDLDEMELPYEDSSPSR